jgi:hypothetical protein
MATQITKMQPGSKRPMGPDWPEEEPHEEDEKDTTKNGTDYIVVKSARLYKSLIHDEDLLKAAEAREEADVDEYEKGKKQGFWEAEEKDDKDVKKSFFEHVEDNPTLMAGIDSSPFLYEMIKSIGYSFMNLEDRLGTQMFLMDHHYDQFAKSVDGVFDSMGKSLGFINETADQIDVVKSAETDEDVQYLEKGDFGNSEAPGQQQILAALVKGVEDGHIPPTEVIKFETTGGLSPHIQKSLGL